MTNEKIGGSSGENSVENFGEKTRESFGENSGENFGEKI